LKSISKKQNQIKQNKRASKPTEDNNGGEFQNKIKSNQKKKISFLFSNHFKREKS